MIITTLPIKVFPVIGTDEYGQPRLGAAKSEMCCPVRLDFIVQNSTVRTDSSASHGHAHEHGDIIKILVPRISTAKIGSVIGILGRKVRVKNSHPRFTVFGQLDHYELECESWL